MLSVLTGTGRRWRGCGCSPGIEHYIHTELQVYVVALEADNQTPGRKVGTSIYR